MAAWEGGKGRRVHLIGWEHPENNDRTVVDQFRVPPGYGDCRERPHRLGPGLWLPDEGRRRR
ncbi:hypothetical protein ACWEQG_02580 [Microbispora sp. NPDC004025]